MARARNIKPGFFTNDDLAEVDALGRLLFVGLWCIADREGRFADRPKRIKAEILPYDDCDVDELLNQLAAHGFVIRYTADGKSYVQIINFKKHQDPHYKEKASEIPAPDGHEDSGKTPGGVPEAVRLAVFVRDGNQCLGCGTADDLSLDHIIPRSKGGSHDESNLQTLCRRCNSAKNNRQAKEDLDQSSANDRPMVGSPSLGQSPLIPDSGFPLPDSPSLNPECGNQREEKPSPPAAQSSRSPKASRLPADWKLPKTWGAWALAEQPGWNEDRIRQTADSFRDYWIAKGGADARKVDWEATWRNWVRREKSTVMRPGAAPINRQEALEARNREVAERFARGA